MNLKRTLSIWLETAIEISEDLPLDGHPLKQCKTKGAPLEDPIPEQQTASAPGHQESAVKTRHLPDHHPWKMPPKDVSQDARSLNPHACA